MNKRKTLRALLIFLGRRMDDRSRLPPGRLNAEIAKAARIEARGWKFLAGEGGDIDALIAEVGEAPHELLLHRHVPESNGRKVGSKATKYLERDERVIAAIRAGTPQLAAIRAVFPVRKQNPTHAKRITRKMKAQDAETRRIIRLQTPDLSPVKR